MISEGCGGCTVAEVRNGVGDLIDGSNTRLAPPYDGIEEMGKPWETES